MFEQAFKNIDDVLRKEAGCTTELDYTEQSSWLLFLKYLNDLEEDRRTEAALNGKKYTYILETPYRWESWAAPKTKDGKLDHNKALTGDDLRDFVSGKLFPYLHGFKQKASGPNTIEYKIGEIFGEIKNKINSGYNLREIIDHIDELRFRSQKEKDELSHLYEAKIRNMGNAGRNGGEYYTPRPLIRAIVQVVKPRIGERIYDGAVGSAGFLCESFVYMKAKKGLTTKDVETLQKCTFYGKEKKSLAYVIAIMNMILHGIEAPNIIHTNTLTENLADIQEKDRVEVVMANPPFGGSERKEVQENFPVRTGETAYLFLQHFIRMLKAGGRGGMVIKNTFLSNGDNASVSLRKLLLESCNLHTVLDCPGGTFQGANVKTVVLFFEKGAPTRKIWYYQLDPGRSLGKTNPLNGDDLVDFVKLQKTFADSPKSWTVDATTIDPKIFDLSVRNPNGGEEIAHRTPQAIMDEIAKLDTESAKVLANIKKRVQGYSQANVLGSNGNWPEKSLIEVCEKITQGPNPKYDKRGVDNFRVLKTKNLYDDAILYEDADRVSKDVFDSVSSSELKNGDVLLAIVGQGSINKCNVFENHTSVRYIYTRALGLIRTKPSELNPYYLRAYLQSKHGKGLVDAGIGGTSGQQVVTTTHIKGLKIPIPPLKVQETIVEQLDALGVETKRLANLYEEKLAALDALNKSLLHQAFTGKL